MGFIVILMLLVILIGAYHLTPVIERFLSNYIKGLSSKQHKGDKKDEF